MLLKKHKRKAKIVFKRIYGLLIILVVLLILLNIFFMKKSLYVSPLSTTSQKIDLSNSYENNLELMLKSYAVSYSSVALEQNRYVISLTGGEQVILDSQKSLNNQISSLQLLLSQLTIEGKHFKTLDFRYNKPIIVFK